MTDQVKIKRRRGWTRISRKHQVTIPVDALAEAGLRAGDQLRAEVRRAGEIVLIQDLDPIERFAGVLTDVYPADHLDALRDEWR